ncbi:DUF3300 domain-containing protein [Cupriavidus sp. BIS7]|uniref:DUF3300 domain-containing protein n=1 Tax=Cupriavidus sp. BIS7 TaxID=1217718 RepID=UPI0002E5BD71|nr:DUF3300 domain-containing protein [Cupriavidus sp. BIS7]
MIQHWVKRLPHTFGAALLTGLFSGLLLVAQGAMAQDKPPAPAPYKAEEIEAMVAPIALYPDDVLSQVLMASTYPLEIVFAARWSKAHPDLKGDAAVKAVQNESWDVSVKSLVAFPQILEPMNDKIDWTQKLGDAFLAQEKDVLAAIQRLRARAKDTGHLESNEQQHVIVEQATSPQAVSQQIVRIEPANPQVIYVPAYDPAVVYGGWAYPAYPYYSWPPYPAYYPGYAFFSGMAWGFGLAAAGAIFGNCNWGGGDVNINVDRAANIDRNFDRNRNQGGRWQHNVDHRKGVAYRDNATRERFGREQAGAADRRSNFRGREPGGAGDRAGVSNRMSNGNLSASDRMNAGNRAENRAGTSDRPGASNRANNANAGNRVGTTDRARAADRYSAGFGGRDNGFQGVGNGSGTQRNYSRGSSSMQSSGFNRGGGGFSGGGRGGGGGGRGGGGRR